MHASLFSAVCFSFAYGQKYIRHNTDNRDRRWSYGVQKPPFHPHPGFGCRYNRRIPHHSRKIRSFRRRMRFCFSCSSFCSGSCIILPPFAVIENKKPALPCKAGIENPCTARTEPPQRFCASSISRKSGAKRSAFPPPKQGSIFQFVGLITRNITHRAGLRLILGRYPHIQYS